MAVQDELFFGAYVGLVVESSDPDDLGRVKVFVPGKNGPLYDGWNNVETDIDFASPTSDKFPSTLLSRLKKTLPWARPAMPLWGGGTGSFTETSSQNPHVVPPDSAFNNSVSLDGSNGRLDTKNKDQLVPVEGFNGHYAHPIVAGKFQELITAAKADGVNLGLSDSYRIEGQPGDSAKGVWSQWAAWERYQAGGNPAAKPGTSNHGYGLAFDFVGKNGTSKEQAYSWLRNNASKYGWSNYVGGSGPDTRGTDENGKPNGTQKEPWHWQINKQDLGKYANYSVNGSTQPAVAVNPDNRETTDDGINNENAEVGKTYSVSDGSSGLAQDEYSLVGPGDVYNAALTYIKNNPNSIYNNKSIPRNGEKYGLNGTPESWATFWAKSASYESSYQNRTINTLDPGGSYGILQVGPAQINSWANVNNNQDLARSYGLDPNKKYTSEEILASADLALRAKLFVGDAIMRSEKYGGFAVGVGKSNGLGATLGENTWKKIARNEPLAEGSKSGNKLVVRTTNQGVNAYGSVNMSRFGGPVGNFSIPMVGAKVWIMFEGGSPQRPIYMGQVFDPSNIQSVG